MSPELQRLFKTIEKSNEENKMKSFNQWRDGLIGNDKHSSTLLEILKPHEGYMRMAWEACERQYRPELAPVVMTLEEYQRKYETKDIQPKEA